MTNGCQMPSGAAAKPTPPVLALAEIPALTEAVAVLLLIGIVAVWVVMGRVW